VKFKTAKAFIAKSKWTMKAMRNYVKRLIADSGGNIHITNVKDGYTSFNQFTKAERPVIEGFGGEEQAIGYGDFDLTLTDVEGREKIIHLKNVLFVPDAAVPIVSVSKMAKDGEGYSVMGDNGGYVKYKEHIFPLDDAEGLYKFVTVFDQRTRDRVWRLRQQAFGHKMRSIGRQRKEPCAQYITQLPTWRNKAEGLREL
jgi:hypothetical protein